MRPKRPTEPKRKKAKPRTRSSLFRKSLLDTFRKRWPNFRQADITTQLQLLKWIMRAFTQQRQHRSDPQAISIHHRELERDFGRGKFVQINALLKLFEVDTHYFSGKGKTASKRRETRRYWLSPDAERIYFEEQSRTSRRNLVALIDGNGRKVRTLPAAVDSLDSQGKKATFWIKEPLPTNLVPVDIGALGKLKAQLPAPDLYKAQDSKKEDYRLKYLGEVRRLAMTAPAGRGFMAHRYQEASTGRLSATDINLQSAPRAVRKAALSGLWDYDFQNCHYSILEQMAARYGLTCPAIAHYMANKEAVRQRLVADIGITLDQVKEALISIIYGARPQESRYVALYKTLNKDFGKLRSLIRHKAYKALSRDVRAATRPILAGWPAKRSRLVNEAGKAISTAVPKDRRMAHLLQGAEACILRAAFRLYPDKIVLLVHDGFVSTGQLDVGLLEAEVFRTTGYRMRLEEDRMAVGAGYDL